MTKVIDEARSMLEGRLAELEAEAERLRQAISQLGRGAGSSARRTRGPARRRTKSGRARPGERDKQLLASITSAPERRVSDHARELGVRPQQLYPVLRRLEQADKIEKTSAGYRAR